jgi:hypothetical protein
MAPYALADAAAHEVVRRMVEARIKGLARIAEVLPSGRQPSGRRGLEPEAPAPAGPTRASAPAGPMAARFPEFDATEAKGQGPAAASLARARLFARDGALLLRRCVPEEAIAAVAAEVAAARDAHRAEMDSGAALRVGPKRFMVTLDTAGAAGGPDVMAPPELMEVLDRLLGKDFVLASVTAVISLPGAPEQKWHRDTRLLFPERTENASPCYSIAALFPLVPLTAAVGATEILPGSHRETNRPTESFPVLRPEAGPGDCYLMDGRLIHRGMSNHSSADRPILSIVYQRPWFRDDLNFSAQPPLHRAPGLAIRLPPERRHLLAWTETG